VSHYHAHSSNQTLTQSLTDSLSQLSNLLLTAVLFDDVSRWNEWVPSDPVTVQEVHSQRLLHLVISILPHTILPHTILSPPSHLLHPIFSISSYSISSYSISSYTISSYFLPSCPTLPFLILSYLLHYVLYHLIPISDNVTKDD
jgi:hypothetical protein